MKKYMIGTPFETEAVIDEIPSEAGLPDIGTTEIHAEQDRFVFSLDLEPEDIVYGLGESMRGINKRGWEYIQNNIDHGDHTEDARYLYGAHNFIVIDRPGKSCLGFFADCPANTVRFDIGYTNPEKLVIEAPISLNFYILEGPGAREVVHEFRKSIGKSYIPPKFAFGYAQSRFEYKDKPTLRRIADTFDALEIPIDMINLDLDYMDERKDFTLHPETFAPDFKDFVEEMKERKIHLVPIIDAAIKQDEEDEIYLSGHEKDCFCKKENGEEFVGAVWPGLTVYPDFLNPEARKWFGDQYKILTDAGIDAFWNDMNEPAIFYSPENKEKFLDWVESFGNSGKEGIYFFEVMMRVHALQNHPEDFRSFYHNTNQGTWRHDLVHNVYGMNMTRATKEALDEQLEKRALLFSRSSYIGAHRYGGIWTGDNSSWWQHLKLILQQLPGLNMAGFLYSGCDLGGFGCDATRDLLLRWIQLGIFTPLMRNHSAGSCRPQEPYRFDQPEDFAHLIGMRYRLIPYIYSEYLKAVQNNEMLFTPLGFEYPDDIRSREIDDQLFFGHEIMLAPVIEQNKTGRMVYLPQEMMLVRFNADGSMDKEILPAGDHYISSPLNALTFLIRKGKAIPLARKALRVGDIDWNHLELTGYAGPDIRYELWDDDGTSLDAEIIVQNMQNRE